MSDKVANQYRIFCNTEQVYVYSWGTSAPIACPNNNTHSVDMNSISITDTIAQNNVTVVQISGDLNSYFRVESKIESIPANSIGTFEYTWPYNIGILTINWTCGEIHRGDTISAYVAPDTVVGVITQNINQGDTVIHVSPTVLANVNRGFMVTVTNGTQTLNLGECYLVNKAAGTISCTTPASTPLSAWSYVQMTINNFKNIHLTEPRTWSFANKHLGSSFIPANTIVKFVYKNNSNTEKTFSFYVEYLF